MAKTIKCKKDYYVSVLKHPPGKPKEGKVFMELTFKEGDDCYYKYDEQERCYFVSKNRQHLSQMQRWEIYVEEMDEEEFVEAFGEVKNRPSTIKHVVDTKRSLQQYNKLVEKIVAGTIDPHERRHYTNLAKQLGMTDGIFPPVWKNEDN